MGSGPDRWRRVHLPALAVVVIGGLVSSTLLTLVLVPALYVLTERRGERKRLRRAAASSAPGEAPAVGSA